jgi:metal-responsive CopG/Arc/MetJ family transcriptional regulator
MHAEKISISLPAETVGFLEAYRTAHGVKTRSQVIDMALKQMRERELEAAYREASAEADAVWEVTAADGLSDETW